MFNYFNCIRLVRHRLKRTKGIAGRNQNYSGRNQETIATGAKSKSRGESQLVPVGKGFGRATKYSLGPLIKIVKPQMYGKDIKSSKEPHYIGAEGGGIRM